MYKMAKCEKFSKEINEIYNQIKTLRKTMMEHTYSIFYGEPPVDQRMVNKLNSMSGYASDSLLAYKVGKTERTTLINSILLLEQRSLFDVLNHKLNSGGKEECVEFAKKIVHTHEMIYALLQDADAKYKDIKTISVAINRVQRGEGNKSDLIKSRLITNAFNQLDVERNLENLYKGPRSIKPFLETLAKEGLSSNASLFTR
jgi:hypothetical protein